jgi:hypothetical protein
MPKNTSGSNDTAVGLGALDKGTSPHDDSAFGNSALFNDSTGGGNNALSENALASNASGVFNTGVGLNALLSMTGGSEDIALGHGAGNGLTGSESSNIDIGNAGTAGESNVIRIGTQGTSGGQQNKAFIAGVSGATVGGTNAAVIVDSNGQLGTVSSSRRFKQDIRALDPATLNPLMSLRPVSFYYKPQYVHGQANTLQYGLIAEEVAKVYPNLVVRGRDGKPFTVAYQELPVLLLARVQRQQRQISALQAENRQLRHQQAEIDWLMHHAKLR